MYRWIRLLAGLAFAIPMFAAAGGAAGLPWELPLSMIATSMTGPVAASITLCGIVITGCMLVFGHDWGEFMRRALLVTCAGCFLLFAAPWLLRLFGVAAAVV